MEVFEYGNPRARTVLLQPVDDHDMKAIERETAEIRKRTEADFRLRAVKIEDWNRDLSPWPAPAVFGNADFGGAASETLRKVLELCGEEGREYVIGGYSLAGLFALWAAHETERFSAVAAASPSVWFPGFTEYMKERTIHSRTVYLSLGDREERTRNPVMAAVGDRIREIHDLLKERQTVCTLEWNSGNHFRDADVRTAKAFAWVLNRLGEKGTEE